ncbi:MAG: erythromycin esterase family protein [Bdellovibrionales bacterium]|nr:erythromycin esterase family protein [Bdellovibrionales bacterium]
MVAKGFTKVSSVPGLQPDKGLISSPLVGLGESAHGSSELHRLAAEVVLGLAKYGSKPLRVLLETPHATLSIAARKVQQGQQVLANDLNATYLVWQTPGMLEALNIFSNINKSSPGRIELKGFDIRQPTAEFEELSRAFPERTALARFAEPVFLKDFERRALAKSLDIQTQTDLNQILAEVNDLDGSKSDAHRRAYRIVRMWADVYSKAGRGMESIFSARDVAMFKMVQDLVVSDRQAVVWAHLGHLLYESRQLESSIAYLKNIDVLGQLLRGTFKERYKLVAVVAHKVDYKTPSGAVSTFTTAPDSIETKLEAHHLYIVNKEAFSSTCPLVMARTDGETKDKESYPEFSFVTPQFDYLLRGR